MIGLALRSLAVYVLTSVSLLCLRLANGLIAVARALDRAAGFTTGLADGLIAVHSRGALHLVYMVPLDSGRVWAAKLWNRGSVVGLVVDDSSGANVESLFVDRGADTDAFRWGSTAAVPWRAANEALLKEPLRVGPGGEAILTFDRNTKRVALVMELRNHTTLGESET